MATRRSCEGFEIESELETWRMRTMLYDAYLILYECMHTLLIIDLLDTASLSPLLFLFLFNSFLSPSSSSTFSQSFSCPRYLSHHFFYDSRHYFAAAPTLAIKGGRQSVHSTCQESLQVSIPLDQLVAPPRRRPTDLISSSNSRLKADLKTKTEFLRRYGILLLVANNFDSRRLTEFQSGFGCRG